MEPLPSALPRAGVPGISFWVLISFILPGIGCTPSVPNPDPIETIKNLQASDELVVRFAKLTIDSSRLDEYKVFLREGIEKAIRREPGVLTLYAFQNENEPCQVTVLEIYANDSAYQSHLATEHFQTYKSGTLDMVKSLELIDLDPIVFGVRNK